MREETTITRQEVRWALQRFQAEDGLIHRLPAQATPARTRVGEGHGAYETLYDALSGGHCPLATTQGRF